MKWAKNFSVILLLFIICPYLNAQNEDNIILLEKYIENTESISDYSELHFQLEQLINHPVNLNDNDFTELNKIPLITPMLIDNLLFHRKQYGDLKSIYELQTIEGFSLEYIHAILPFVTVIKNEHFSHLFSKSNHELNHELLILSQRKFPKSIGYNLPDSNINSFKGSPERVLIRYKARLNDYWQLSLNAEKDAGEQFNLNGVFISSNLVLNNYKKIKQLIIGDFQANFGQGLTFSNGMAFGKSPNSINICRFNDGIKAYRGLNENNFLRGIAIQNVWNKHVNSTLFLSNKKMNANQMMDSLYNSGFSSLANTGLYRNQTELNGKDNIEAFTTGANINYRKNLFSFGITSVYTKYNINKTIDSSKPYQLYYPNGKAFINHGLNFNYTIKNVLFFGELTYFQIPNSLSGISGIIASISKEIDISILYRNYNKKATPISSNAFGESSRNSNENGIYMGICIQPIKNHKINAYFDHYQFPWLRYLVNAPSTGKDLLIEWQYNKRKSFQWYIRYKNEEKQKNKSETSIYDPIITNQRQSLRFNISSNLNEKISVQNRLEIVQFNEKFKGNVRGYSLFQDIKVNFSKKIKLIARWMVFNVDEYDARIYAYENDVLYSYSVPLFQNIGQRYYLMGKIKCFKNFDLWVRIAHTNYKNINQIGSNYDTIKNNYITELKTQIKWTF